MPTTIHLCTALLLGAIPAAIDSDFYAVDTYAIVAGSGTRVSNLCFRMTAVIGEPTVVTSTGGGYVLSTGSLAITPEASDDVFFDGFEDCTP